MLIPKIWAANSSAKDSLSAFQGVNMLWCADEGNSFTLDDILAMETNTPII